MISVPLKPDHVEQIVLEFGLTVDKIEDHLFEPPSLAVLKQKLPGMTARFAVAVCRNCDARFSCGAWREYAIQSNAGGEAQFKQYLEDLGDEVELKDNLLNVIRL